MKIGIDIKANSNLGFLKNLTLFEGLVKSVNIKFLDIPFLDFKYPIEVNMDDFFTILDVPHNIVFAEVFASNKDEAIALSTVEDFINSKDFEFVLLIIDSYYVELLIKNQNILEKLYTVFQEEDDLNIEYIETDTYQRTKLEVL